MQLSKWVGNWKNYVKRGTHKPGKAPKFPFHPVRQGHRSKLKHEPGQKKKPDPLYGLGAETEGRGSGVSPTKVDKKREVIIGGGNNGNMWVGLGGTSRGGGGPKPPLSRPNLTSKNSKTVIAATGRGNRGGNTD